MIRFFILILVAFLAISVGTSVEAGKGRNPNRLTDDVTVSPNPTSASSPITIHADHLTPNQGHMIAYCGVGLHVWSDDGGEISVESYSCTVTDDLRMLEYAGGVSASYHEVGRVTVVIQ